MASRSSRKEVKELLKEIASAGYQVEIGRSKTHYKVYEPEGRLVFVLPNTPGRGRAMANLKAALKREGILAR